MAANPGPWHLTASGHHSLSQADTLFRLRTRPSQIWILPIDSLTISTDRSSVTVRIRVGVNLRLTVYRQTVRLGAMPFESQDQRFLFLANEPLRSKSLYNVLSNEKMDLSLINRLRLCQVQASHVWHVIENSSLCTIYNSPGSTGST
jgi:hypothetical protein